MAAAATTAATVDNGNSVKLFDELEDEEDEEDEDEEDDDEEDDE